MTVLGTLGTVAGGQYVGSRILSRFKKDVTWDAKLEGLSASIQLAIGTGLRGTILSARANEATSPIGIPDQERFFSGKWLQVSTGLDLGNYGGLGKGEFINSSFKLTSPGVFGANPGVLSGATAFSSVTSGLRTATFAIIRLGSGTIVSFKDTDVNANISLYSGISIPILGEEDSM